MMTAFFLACAAINALGVMLNLKTDRLGYCKTVPFLMAVFQGLLIAVCVVSIFGVNGE